MAKYTEDDDNTLDERKAAEGGSDRSEKEIEGLSTEAESADGERDADDTGDDTDPAKAVVGLKKRLAKLTAQRNDARKKAEERDALEARVRAYEKRERDEVEVRRAKERATPEGQKADRERAAIKAAIDDTYGDGTSDYLETRRERESRERDAYADRGISYLRSELEDHGIKVDDATLVRWERAVGGEMDADRELLSAFRTPSLQSKAIKEAVDRVRDGLVNPITKDRGGKPLERAQRNRESVLGGGRNTGAVSQAAEPEFELKPPKDLKGRALTEWWEDQRAGVWKKIVAQDASA